MDIVYTTTTRISLSIPLASFSLNEVFIDISPRVGLQSVLERRVKIAHPII